MSGRRIYVDCYSPYYRAALTEMGKLTELIFQDKENKACNGDIYIGRVEKILPSKFAFINIGEEEPVFLQLNDKAEIENTKGIKQGQEILIQITKEAFDEKRAAATTNISRAGRYCVVVKDRGKTGVSKKITDSDLRERLKNIADENTKEEYSVVIRTGAKDTDENTIKEEIISLTKELVEIEERGRYTKAPAVIYKEVNPLNRVLRDLADDECIIVVNDKKEFESLDVNWKNVELYEGDIPLFINYGIENQIEKLFHRKIWLDSGCYIVIDETEAMNVIDVNSGKSVKVKDSFKINKEAAVEIARQIRLRNLNGMIIIDFINMRDKKSCEELYKILKRELLKDRISTHIVGMTELGLMQITREKKRKALSRYIYHKCSMCDGLGRVKDISYIADSINNEIINIVSSTVYNHIKLYSNLKIIESLEKRKKLIEERYNCKIELNTIVTSRFDYYEIEKSVLKQD